MNISFFIGNGFDINLGLRTAYSEFIKWYLKQETNNPVISEFKKMIASNIDTWSNLEVALGQKTIAFPLDNPETFIMCKKDLDVHLQIYLRKENYRFSSNPLPEYISQFKDSLIHYKKYCDSKVQRELNAIYKFYIKEDRCYNIITFNFTDTVDVLWAKTTSKFAKRTIRKRKVSNDDFFDRIAKALDSIVTYDYKGQLIHIHGTIDNAMMTGVNDIEQISNVKFRVNEDVLDCCIKPLMNENCGNRLNDRVSDIIEKTNVFVVFGMSIGETDKIWWDKIVRRVIENEHCYLLLVNYDNSFDRILPYTATYATKSMVANLYRITNLDERECAILNSRLGIQFNTDIFKLTADQTYEKLRHKKRAISRKIKSYWRLFCDNFSVYLISFILVILIILTMLVILKSGNLLVKS